MNAWTPSVTYKFFDQNGNRITIKKNAWITVSSLNSAGPNWDRNKNHAMAKNISDVGWRQLITQLKYKAVLYERTYILVNPAYTTQICHDCGYQMGSDSHSHKLKLKDRYWLCPACHTLHVRDWNAAKNILTKGLNKYDFIPLHVANVYE